MSSDLFKEIIPSILKSKEKVEFEPKDYPPWVVNKALSYHWDCIYQANDMNLNPQLPREMQYDYLWHSCRKYKRAWQPWEKRVITDKFETIKKYYNYSNSKAREVMNLLSDKDIKEMKETMETGGLQSTK